MRPDHLIAWALQVFVADASVPPPLTLRGGSSVDSYDDPPPFDVERDEPTAEYIERYAYFALPYLDPRSWRHYLPALIKYATRHPADPAMVTEALIRSLRPPDRVPARLTTLSPQQEMCVTAFLEWLGLEDGSVYPELAEEARQALDEWWLPHARHRPAPGTAQCEERPSTWRAAGDGPYQFTLPVSMSGGGAHSVRGEDRTFEGWRGVIAGDSHARVVINREPRGAAAAPRRLELVTSRLPHARIERVDVHGASRAWRVDAQTYEYSPAEPQRIVLIYAAQGPSLVTFTITWYPGPLADATAERILGSFRLQTPESAQGS